MRPTKAALRARLRLSGIALAGVAAITLGVVTALTLGGGNDKANAGKDIKSRRPSTSSASPASTAPGKKLTPATSPRKIVLPKPGAVKNGIRVGFPHTANGAEWAAISYWQDLDILDDTIARRQWTQITSKDSPGTVDAKVSDVRKVREGVGLAPSGGTPAGLTFSTVVDAAQATSMDASGDVVEVWMVYDRYATLPADKGGADNPPLKGQTTDLIVKWEDGDWKVTEEAQYTKHKHFPVAYAPDSWYAFEDGWREVSQ